jgi:hypothetical protein
VFRTRCAGFDGLASTRHGPIVLGLDDGAIGCRSAWSSAKRRRAKIRPTATRHAVLASKSVNAGEFDRRVEAAFQPCFLRIG